MKYQDLSTHRGIVALVDINVAHPDVGIKVVWLPAVFEERWDVIGKFTIYKFLNISNFWIKGVKRNKILWEFKLNIANGA